MRTKWEDLMKNSHTQFVLTFQQGKCTAAALGPATCSPTEPTGIDQAPNLTLKLADLHTNSYKLHNTMQCSATLPCWFLIMVVTASIFCQAQG